MLSQVRRVVAPMGVVLAAVGLAPGLLPAQDAPNRASRPNVIVVMTDDQGFGDLSLHGNPVLRTPNLDALAEESVQVRQFYVHPVCTPTRASLFTGRYPQRSTAIDTYRGRAMLDPDALTIAEMLGGAGIASGIFGKWHLGDCAPMRPIDQGFERSVVHRGGGIGQPSDPLGAEGDYTDPVLADQGEDRKFDGYCTDIYFDEAMRWIDACRDANRPFFCAITPNAPHTPLHDVPEDLRERYAAMDLSASAFAGEPGWKANFGDADKLSRLYAMVENIDQNMGRLVSFLDESGLAENTLLLFFCDNGPQGRRFNAGLRGSKGNVHEGGIRSPFFARWPAQLEPRVVEDGYGAHLDLVPTILAACGVDRPDGHVLDGTDILPLLRGEEGAAAATMNRPLVLQWHRGDFPVYGHHVAVRHGQYKLAQVTNAGQERDTPPEWKPQLFDLAADPFEQQDLAGERPEVVAQMTATYRAWFADVAGAAMPPADAAAAKKHWWPKPIRIGGDGAERVVLTRQDWRPVAGNGWGQNGVWSVRFDDAGPWKVTATMMPKTKASRAELGVWGEGTDVPAPHSADVPDGARQVVFDNVTGFTPGETFALWCTLHEGEKEERGGPYQMLIERADG
jgi:arylsulfatase A-like enzyme